MTLIIPKNVADQQEKEGLLNHFNQEMEKVINKNKDKDKFWILGKVKFLPEHGGEVARTFLDSCDEKPPIVKGSFVYEVDNRKGSKELLWTCDNESLRIVPTKKTVQVSPT